MKGSAEKYLSPIDIIFLLSNQMWLQFILNMSASSSVLLRNVARGLAFSRVYFIWRYFYRNLQDLPNLM